MVYLLNRIIYFETPSTMIMLLFSEKVWQRFRADTKYEWPLWPWPLTREFVCEQWPQRRKHLCKFISKTFQAWRSKSTQPTDMVIHNIPPNPKGKTLFVGGIIMFYQYGNGHVFYINVHLFVIAEQRWGQCKQNLTNVSRLFLYGV